MKPNAIRVVVVDDNALRAAILVDGLREAGIDGVEVIETSTQLVRRIAAIDPDVIIIDLENPSRDMLEQMFQVSRVVSRPVAMFVDQSDQSMIRAAVDAGVSAYIVDGLKKERVKAIVDMAISRFEAFDRLQRELVEARRKGLSRAVAAKVAATAEVDSLRFQVVAEPGIDGGAAFAHVLRLALSVQFHAQVMAWNKQRSGAATP